MRRGTFVPFHKLQRPVQRANHNLWLARSSKDKTLIPERDIPIDSETVDTINSNLELFNRDQFDINSTILASRSNSDLVGKRVPTPPPSDSESNQGDWSPRSDNPDEGENHSIGSFDKELDLELEEGEIIDNISAMSENDDEFENNPYISGVNNDGSRFIPPVMIGFSGRPLSDSREKEAVQFITEKAIHLLDDTILSYETCKRFADQCRRRDFNLDLDTLITPIAMEMIVRTALADIQGQSEDDALRRSQLYDLKRFSCRKDGETVILDKDVWNTNSFLDLLLDTYPKESVKSKGLGNFHQVMNKINPLYNYDDAKEEQKTVRNILILQKQYGFDNIAVTEEKQAVKALIGKWPKMVQENFKAYVGGGSCDTLSQWIDHFLGWCSRARHAKATAESTLYTVSASRFTVFLKFNAEEKESYKEIPGWNRAENRSQKRALENNNHNSGGAAKKQDVQYIPSDSLCNHCGRKSHPHDEPHGCPFIVFHPNVNKERDVAFIDSTQGKLYGAPPLNNYYLNPVKAADGTAIKPPPTFKCPSGPAPRISSGTQHPKGERNDTSDVSSNILTNYLSALSRQTNDDDLLPCTVSFPFQAVLNQLEERNMERGDVGNHNRISNSNVDSTVYIYALLDQGSLAGDFISLRVLNILKMKSKDASYNSVMNLSNLAVDRPLATPICSGLDGTCSDIPAQTLIKNLSCAIQPTFSFQIAVRVLTDSPFDLIIGRETVKNFNLGMLLPSHFFNEEVSRAILDTTHPLLLRSKSVHGTLSSEKDNSSQALPMEPLYEAPCVGCSSRRCGSPTGPESCPSCVHVKSKGGNKKVETDSRTHTRSRAEEQLDSLSGVTRPAPLAPAQTHRNLIAALVESRENALVERANKEK